MQHTENYIEKAKQNNKITSKIKRAMPVLSLVVMASVFWTLKLTGITMAGEAFCGKTEHTHDENCGQPQLICTLTETEGHYHTENCIAQHLTCEIQESEGHFHSEECYTAQLECTLAESEGHSHTEECKTTTVICNTEEHTHTDECVTEEITCTLAESEGHSHTEECKTTTVICTTEEHTHTDECVTEEITCTLAESEGHSHTEECKTTTVICNTEEHTHTDECVTEEITCTLEESEGHFHSETCYTYTLICTQAESEGHSHTENCYTKGVGFICTQTEENAQTAATEDPATEDPAAEHRHTAECVGAETELCCGSEVIVPHTHTETCYGPAQECQLEIHTHTAECYSDINADIETQAQWEATVAGIVPNARPQDNIVAVANSQLGYTESTKNYQVDQDGNKNGYSRYGQWYGNPYGQWNTMFVSFCLHYSQLPGIPLSAGADTMLIEWENIGLYIPAQDAQPSRGDLIFLDKNSNGAADAVAIVTAYQDGNVSVIQGDLDNMVAETTYADTDAAIMGYGVIPNMNMIMTLEEDPEGYSEEITGTYIADAVAYDTGLFAANQKLVLYSRYSDGKYYAIDGNGNAVQVKIDKDNNIYTDSVDINSLLWTFTAKESGYAVKNVSTNKYLHPYYNNANDHGIISGTDWVTQVHTVTADGNITGIRLQGQNQTACAYQESTAKFVESTTALSVFQIGKVGADCKVWFDGTNGGIRAYAGAQQESWTVKIGEPLILPDKCTSPTKYSHALKGWYDVTNSKYYPIGATVEITGNTVFYAYWEAETYDVGIYDENIVTTVSTNEFVTTRVFDFGYLFNALSANPTVTYTSSGHNESWNFVPVTGEVKYTNDPSQTTGTTLDYAFVDRTGGGKLSEPNNLNNYNGVRYQDIHPNLLDGEDGKKLKDILFGTENTFNTETGEGIIGKTYLGEGDYLFQYISDTQDPHYGYYFYDSELNAASYNQSRQRFYVYNYLEKTSDSSDADFLPLNSPYANTEDLEVGRYGNNKNYNYDISSDGSVMANMAYGMNIDVKYHLAYEPGGKDENGEYGNLDVFGNEMHFEFTGDDDLWIFIKDVKTGEETLVLDLGGIHQAKSGSINFTTGVVKVQNAQDDELTNNLKSIKSGEHIMQIYYLERGSSQSNCSMYFNISPRYSLNIRKEDVLSQEALDGTEFSIYTDAECENLAQLWTSKESYMNDDNPAEKFKVTNGSVDIWGFSAGSTYYIKEVTPPENDKYEQAFGIIKFTIGKSGIATYDVTMLEETDENGEKIPISPGYTVHGVHIDEKMQKAYLTVTNAEKWIESTTSVQIVKIWEDDKKHDEDYITVYLTVKDPDPNVPERRIREVILSEENNWRYLWTGLQEKNEDGTDVIYGVYETYEEGYYSQSEPVEGDIVINKSELAETEELNNGEYLIKTSKGYLATASSTGTTFKEYTNRQDAENSDLAWWTVSKNRDNQVKLTNRAGQIITYVDKGSRCFTVSTDVNDSKQYLAVREQDNGTFKFKNGDYWIGTSNSGGSSFRRQRYESDAEVFTMYTLLTETDLITVEKHGFTITNTPLAEETSVKVTKYWDAQDLEYQESQVTVKLLANDVDTGRKIVLNLQNKWTDTFKGLPYRDENNNVIKYTVEEVWSEFGWKIVYGPMEETDERVPNYSTTITNVQIPTGPALPSTGSFARLGYIYCGGGMMLASLVTAIRLRRKKERRSK